VGSRHSAVVDAEDFDSLIKYSWSLDRKYAARMERGRKVYMHAQVHALMTGSATYGHKVDHKNCDQLDNRRENLRLATHAQNMHNRPCRKDSRSGFKCVKLCVGKRNTTYEAYIYAEKGSRVSLGRYPDGVSASLAHEYAAGVLRRQFAYRRSSNGIVSRSVRERVLTKLREHGLIRSE